MPTCLADSTKFQQFCGLLLSLASVSEGTVMTDFASTTYRQFFLAEILSTSCKGDLNLSLDSTVASSVLDSTATESLRKHLKESNEHVAMVFILMHLQGDGSLQG